LRLAVLLPVLIKGLINKIKHPSNHNQEERSLINHDEERHGDPTIDYNILDLVIIALLEEVVLN
jgi:hypothetical protein